MQNIGAVILAAGGSSRFGQPKQLLPFRGKTLVRTIIDAACEAGCSPVVVVIGSNGETIHPEVAHANVLEARNTNWRSGIGSSMRSGVQALISHAPDVEAILLLVCDQPAVNVPFIERLIATHETTKKDVIASSYAETVGVPALFNRSFFEELLSLDDETGAKSVIPVRSVPSPTVFLLSEFAAGAFGAILNVAMAVVFVYAYTRARQSFFLILCLGALAFAVQNAYGATLVLAGLMHAQIFPPFVMRILTSMYVAITPVEFVSAESSAFTDRSSDAGVSACPAGLIV